MDITKSDGLLPGMLNPLVLKAISLDRLHGYGVLLRIQQILGPQSEAGLAVSGSPPARAPGAHRVGMGERERDTVMRAQPIASAAASAEPCSQDAAQDSLDGQYRVRLREIGDIGHLLGERCLRRLLPSSGPPVDSDTSRSERLARAGPRAPCYDDAGWPFYSRHSPDGWSVLACRPAVRRSRFPAACARCDGHIAAVTRLPLQLPELTGWLTWLTDSLGSSLRRREEVSRPQWIRCSRMSAPPCAGSPASAASR